MIIPLTGFQRKYLRGLAHSLKPIVLIGSKGVTQSIIDALDEALMDHELVKVKFVDNKNKDFKSIALQDLEGATAAHMVGMIGHTAIFYRPHPDLEKRKISLPTL